MNRIVILALCLTSVMTTVTFGDENVPSDKLILLPVKNDPTVSFRIWFKVGSQNDPAGKEGLANITASMLTDAATQKNSYEDILDKLYPLATSYNSSTSAEMTIISGRTHKDNLKEFYSLLTDAILTPAFKEEDLTRIKSQVLNYLENTLRYASDEELGKAALYNSIFSGTPYGHIDEGLIKSVNSITVDDVEAFYKKYYTRDNLAIGLGGGYDGALVDQIKSDLGRLPAGAVAEVPKPEPKPIKGRKVVIVDKDAASTAISMGFPVNIVRGTKEWYALAIANSWLGQHRNSSSHLYQVIREERGLNYGDYSYLENFPNGGQRTVPPQNVSRRQQIFEIWIRPVPNETRHFALRAAVRELKNLVDNGMTEKEFLLTRAFLKNFVLHYAPTTMERLGYAIDDRFYALNGSHLETFRKMMSTVTLKDVNAAVKKFLQYNNMEIAIVTKDAAAFKEALAKDVPSPITYATPKPQSVMDEDKEIGVFPLGIKADDVTIVPVAELFEK